jgi:hypothetical protein
MTHAEDHNLQSCNHNCKGGFEKESGRSDVAMRRPAPARAKRWTVLHSPMIWQITVRFLARDVNHMTVAACLHLYLLSLDHSCTASHLLISL